MGTLITNTCWPSRFSGKWLAFFGVALFVGTILGLLHHKPKPRSAPPAFQVQGQIVVYVQYLGEPDAQRTNALVYFTGPNQPLTKDRLTYVTAHEPGLRVQTANAHYDFMVYPSRWNKKPEGQPVYCPVTWPDREHAEVKLFIKRTYPRPKP